MSDTAFVCRRCGQSDAPLGAPPFPGPLGLEIASQTCARCWADWERTEVMMINELKLNFMDPAAQDILAGHMRTFLLLDGGTDGDSG